MGCLDLGCLPTAELFLGVLSLRLGSLIIALYSIAHAWIAGYNNDFLKRRELEVNLNAAFSGIFFFVSLCLLVGVLMERQGLCLIWVWMTLILCVPWFIVLIVVASIHYAMENEADLAYRNMLSAGMHLLVFYFIIVVNSYKIEIEMLEEMDERDFKDEE